MGFAVMMGSVPVWLAGAAFAVEAEKGPDPTATQQVIDVLCEQGTIPAEKCAELASEAQQEAAAASTPAVDSNPEGWSAFWDDGFKVERNDKKFKLKFGGRAQLDAGVLSPSRRLDGMYDVRGTGGEIRRARLFTSGDFYDHGTFKLQLDFADGEVAIKDAYVGLKKLPYVGTVLAGHHKEHFSIEELTSTKYITFMERAAPVEAFAPSRNLGVSVQNHFFDQHMTAALGAFQQVNDGASDGFGRSGMYNLTLRLTGAPIYEDEGNHVVHVGFGYQHKFRSSAFVDYRARPEVHLAPRFLDTLGILSDGADTLDFELATVCGPLSFQGEWFMSWLDRSNDALVFESLPLFGDPMRAPFMLPSDVQFQGGYAQVSYFLTGERRNYDPRKGSFGRTKPNEVFSISDGTWGAFEVGLRFSHLDLDDGDVRGGIQNNVTAAMNWYLYPNLRMMFNVVRSTVSGKGEMMAYQSRLSLDF